MEDELRPQYILFYRRVESQTHELRALESNMSVLEINVIYNLLNL